MATSSKAVDGIQEELAVRIEVTRIHLYERNPRRQLNPEYQRIKASIRTAGLDQPLVITRKPGSADYVLQAGGNTRLQILKELYEETKDERFYWVNCLLKPWVDESSLLFAHLRENELRGSLHFIDKAQAVLEAKQLLEAELKISDLSQRGLESLFKERGLSLSHSMISQMTYAVRHLLPLIPQALSAGLGRTQVEKIRALDRIARQAWSCRSLGDEDSYDAVFATLCRRYDGLEWDIQSLRAALENEIAEEAEQGLQSIRLEFEARLAGRDIPAIEVEKKEPLPVGTAKVEIKTGVGSVEDKDANSTKLLREADKAIDPSHVQDGVDSLSPQPDILSQHDVDANGDDNSISAIDPSTERVLPDTVFNPVLPPLPEKLANNLKSLRARAWTLASRLAQRNGLGDLIQAIPNQGLGFLLRDVPDPALVESLDAEMLGQVSTLWWQLAACAEVTVAPVDILVKHLSDSVILKQALQAQDAGLLFNSVWTLDPGQAGHQLWQQLSDADWQDLLQLMDTYRHLKRLAVDTDTDLWRSPPDLARGD